MKSPRDLLLSRHQAAQPELDRLRRAVVARAWKPQVPGLKGSWSEWAVDFFREALWPWRRAWFGLATVWVVILALPSTAERSPHHGQFEPVRLSPAALAELKAQHRWRDELLGALPSVRSTSDQPPLRPQSYHRSAEPQSGPPGHESAPGAGGQPI